jgi:hypothetical protein
LDDFLDSLLVADASANVCQQHRYDTDEHLPLRFVRPDEHTVEIPANGQDRWMGAVEQLRMPSD